MPCGLPSLRLIAKATGFPLKSELDEGDFAVIFGDYASLVAFAQVICPSIQQGSPVVFVDGGNSFDPYLVAEFARWNRIDPKKFLGKIYVSRAFTAHQLYSLIMERIEDFAESVRARLVAVSDIASPLFHKDVPDCEAKELFLKIVVKLSEIATKNQKLVLAIYNPQIRSRRRAYFEASLFGRSSVLIEVAMRGGTIRIALRKRMITEPLVAEITPHPSLVDYMEVPGLG